MKKNLFLFLSFVTFFQANAQKNVIKANILSPIVKTGSFAYEHAITENSSLQLGFFITSANFGDSKFNGFGVTPEYRFYLSESKDILNGFYVAPFLRYRSLDITDEFSNEDATIRTYGGGVIIGHQWIFKERFSLDMFLGPSYDGYSIDDSDDFDIDIVTNYGVRAGITFGLAF